MRKKFLIPVLFWVSFFAVCTVGCEIFNSGLDSPSNENSQGNSPDTGGNGTSAARPGSGASQTPGASQPPGTPQIPGAQDTTWYVSATGSDSAAGDSAAAPLATVQMALNKVKSLYRAGKWPKDESAEIIVSGTITASSRDGASSAMVDVSGAGNYPPIILRGDPVTGGVLDAGKVGGNGRQVLYIGNNKVTLGDKLVLTGGRSLWGGAVCIGTHGSESEGEFVMAGGEIRGNSGGSGGGVMIYKGRMSMLGGLITENNNAFNKNGGDGGGVYVFSGTHFIMSGGKITNNGGKETINGGGIFVDGTSQASMTEGEITGNESAAKGGGVYIAAMGDFAMSGGTISGNVSAEGGGIGQSQYGAVFTKTGGFVTGNTPNN